MLALSRKKNEAIVVNNNVEITILEIKGDQVKLGITAPREVPVYRKEVYVQIQEANKEAMSAENLLNLNIRQTGLNVAQQNAQTYYVSKLWNLDTV